jgi:transposase
MPRGKAITIALTGREREALERNVRRRNGAYALAQRSRMILLAADGLSNQDIASRAGTSAATVSLWRRRFAEKRIAGLQEEPRGGRPRKIGDDQVETVIAATLQSAPEGAPQWSTRLMARKMGMSQSAISRIWRKSGLSPRRMDSGPRDANALTSDSRRGAPRPRRP